MSTGASRPDRPRVRRVRRARRWRRSPPGAGSSPRCCCCTLTLFRADGTEDVGGSGAVVAGRTWARAALRPAAGDLVLLADTSLICEPDFYRVDADRLLTRDCVQARGEAFLKSSIAPAACAQWRGRAESLR